MNKQSASGETTVEDAAPQRYWIDPALYLQRGQSFEFALRERLCANSREGIKVQIALNASPPQSSRKTSSSSGANVSPVDAMIREIRECCSKLPEFEEGRKGMSEVLFRVILANGNRPKTATQLYESTLERLGPADGRSVTVEMLERLLSADKTYGFAAI